MIAVGQLMSEVKDLGLWDTTTIFFRKCARRRDVRNCNCIFALSVVGDHGYKRKCDMMRVVACPLLTYCPNHP
jgi:hypothetical protein